MKKVRVVPLVLLSSADSAVVASGPPISEAVMTTLTSTQRDEIDKAICELDPLSQAEGAKRSEDEYNGLRDTIIDGLESDKNKFELTLAVSAQFGLMGVLEDSVDVNSFIAKVLKIAGRPDSE
jgi:hypothetical protein